MDSQVLSEKIKEYSSLLPLIEEQDALFVFDLDNTLIRPVNSLGSVEWFFSYIERALAKAEDREKCLRRCVSLWKALQSLIPVQLLEKEAAQIIKTLQKKAPVIALTAREPDFKHVTQQQLCSVDIDFKISAPAPGEFHLSKIPIAEYCDGVLFAGGYHKGEVLLSFLEQIEYKPKRIVFSDDNSYEVKRVAIVEKEGIDYIGIRYAAADHYIQSFDADECDEMLKSLMQTLHSSKSS